MKISTILDHIDSERSLDGAHAMPVGNPTRVSGRNPGTWRGLVAPANPDSARERSARIQQSAVRAPSGLRSLNALMHRDYAVPAPVQIRVCEDKLKLWNPAVLPEGWSLQKLLGEHPSLPFNPLVANAFFRAGEIEAWGRGIDRIFQACREAATPEPLWRLDANELWLEFPFSSAYQEAVGGRSGRTAQETTQETTQETAATPQERICRFLQEEPHLTRRELAERLALTPDGVKYHLEKLKAAGRIRHVGPTKAGRWEVLK